MARKGYDPLLEIPMPGREPPKGPKEALKSVLRSGLGHVGQVLGHVQESVSGGALDPNPDNPEPKWYPLNPDYGVGGLGTASEAMAKNNPITYMNSLREKGGPEVDASIAGYECVEEGSGGEREREEGVHYVVDVSMMHVHRWQTLCRTEHFFALGLALQSVGDPCREMHRITPL